MQDLSSIEGNGLRASLWRSLCDAAGSPDDLWEICRILAPLLHEGSLLLDPNDRALFLDDEAIRLLETGSVEAADWHTAA
jgi:hypothetical protein